MDNPNILIIGAGAAGIACATKLLENGFKTVFLIEAENYIGGRINTITFADNVIDLGAQWCHGEKNNVVFEIANKKKLLETSGNVYITFQSIRSNGEIVTDDVVEKMKDIISKIFQRIPTDLANFDGSLDTYLELQFFTELNRLRPTEIDRDIAEEYFDNFKKIESSHTSVGIEELSGSSYEEYWDCEGDYLLNWKDKGFAEFLKLLLKTVPNGPAYGMLNGKIATGMTVEHINSDRTDGLVEVKCVGVDETFLADHVVVTVSLGVLKENLATLFHPQLTAKKTQAIEGLGYGNIAKIFLEFPEQFWHESWTGFNALWRKEDYLEIIATNLAWTVHIYGFYTVNYQPRLLTCWLVGPNAVNMELLSEAEVIEGCMSVLTRFLIWDVPEPLKIRRSMWQSNKNFRGAYSFRSTKTDDMLTGAAQLGEPLTLLAPAHSSAPWRTSDGETSQRLKVKPIVQFAGEACSEHYFSTVHGAVESGWREADRLISHYERF